MKPLPKIAQCACGQDKPESVHLTRNSLVAIRCRNWCCCIGPRRKTERAAIVAWNQIMRPAHKKKSDSLPKKRSG